MMIRHLTLFAVLLQATTNILVESAKQQVQLSDSYLPVAMQVIAHLTDQMAYEIKDESTTSKPPTTRPNRPSTPSRPSTSNRPSSPNRPPAQNRPTVRPTSQPVYVVSSSIPGSFQSTTNGWWMSYGTRRFHMTTPFHKPGLYAPLHPPKPSDSFYYRYPNGFILLPFGNPQYTPIIQPQEKITEAPLLTIQQEEVKPLVEPIPQNGHFLPPNFDTSAEEPSSRSNGFIGDDLNDDNLQYLSENVRDMIRLANDPHDERIVDVWEGVRAGPSGAMPRGKLSGSNLRLLLLYDLLSREAKRQRLSDYSGFSPDVLRTLSESSSGGARAQLSLALSKMVERKDCAHEYANNRAKEMVQELARDDSKLSSELRYLQPLAYRY